MFYWIFEYGKVLAAYAFILYVWPSVVFRKYLSKKGHAYRFAFCSTFMIMLLNTVVLMLGIMKLLNLWVIRILFYGPLVYIAGKWVYGNWDKTIYIKYLITGIYSPKRFFADVFAQIGNAVKVSIRRLINKIRPNLLVYIMMTAVVIYGMIYFSWSAFSERYFGTSDIYVHHSWTDMLTNGKAFGAGVYPEGMHCFVYGMNALCGVEIYSCLLFLGGIHISAFLAAAYLFFREMLPWKFSGVLALVLFLILRLDHAHMVGSMNRLQMALPQEFALHAVLLCATFLLRFLRQAPAARFQWKRWRFCRDENLLIFMMAMAVTIAVHFYATIMAFLLCVAISVFFLVAVFTRKKFAPLVITIICGVVLAMTPMLVALATGIEFQGSIDWALGLIEDSREEQKEEQKEEQNGTDRPMGGIIWGDGSAEDDAPGETDKETQDPENPEIPEIPKVPQTPKENLLRKFYNYTYASIYKKDRAPLIAGFSLVGALLGVICHIIAVIRRKARVWNSRFCGYLFLVATSLAFMMLFAAPKFGLPEIVQASRLGSITHLLTIPIVLIPLDLIMTWISKKGSGVLINLCAAVLCVGMCVSVVTMGEYHSYLSCVSTRYTAAAEVTNDIIHSMKPESFTIVSPVEELYHINKYGYHVESVEFIHKMKEETYTIPTEYVFIYIEKQPIVYSHTHFATGPSWLAGNAYAQLIEGSSQCPEVKHTEISDEYANKNIIIPIHYDSYIDSERRTVIFSRMYQWAERFKELYPYQLTTVYEDEGFVCYMFRQNQARLLELAIMD